MWPAEGRLGSGRVLHVVLVEEMGTPPQESSSVLERHSVPVLHKERVHVAIEAESHWILVIRVHLHQNQGYVCPSFGGFRSWRKKLPAGTPARTNPKALAFLP